ncbi:MAG: T9SS type A sorting domain-containing protein, partial [Candidatus Eisenbacteria bacterium]|nr:T9SS type A sorting domain-containing protein [Candidatus Eisenbacteria bacterium]
TSTVFQGGLNSLADPHLVSDNSQYANYNLYICFQDGTDNNGFDISVSRSTTYGSTWETPYKLLDQGGTFYFYATARLAFGDRLHLAVAYNNLVTDEGVTQYLYGDSRLANGILDWGSIRTFGSFFDGETHFTTRVAASNANEVLVAWNQDLELHWASSTNDGATFSSTTSATNFALQELGVEQDHFAMLSQNNVPGDGIRLGKPIGPDLQGLWLSLDFMDDYSTINPLGTMGFAFDEVEGGWMATGTMTPLAGINPVEGFYFDAEWRNGEGYPNWEEPPVALTNSPLTAPALADIDGDNDLEVVYSDDAGWLHAVQPNGTPVAGWPKSVGIVDTKARAAVGDVDGGGDNEVAFCGPTGTLYLLNGDGSNRAGWPVGIPTNAGGYVSMAPVSGASPQDVVVLSNNQLFMYDFLGNLHSGFPVNLAENASAPAALGDVDNDGLIEIVVAATNWLYIFGPTGSLEAVTNFVDTASESPSLGDTDNDGELEIAVPTTNGRVHLFGPNAASEPGWPVTEPDGSPITQVALVNYLGTTEEDVAYATSGGSLVSRFGTGAPTIGYPEPVAGTGALTTAPIVEKFHDAPNTALLVGRDDYLHAWSNLNHPSGGYPRAISGDVTLTPAAADIDLDGSLEFVVLTDSAMEVFDVNRPPENNIGWHWPMHAANAARTSCSVCSYSTVTGIGDDTLAAQNLMFAGPVPNPVTSSTSLQYALPQTASIELAIFDVQGRKVWQVTRGDHAEGSHEVRWDATDFKGRSVSPGVYFARLHAMGNAFSKIETRKLVVER